MNLNCMRLCLGLTLLMAATTVVNGSPEERSIMVARFVPFEGERNVALEKTIAQSLQKHLISAGYRVRAVGPADRSSLPSVIAGARESASQLLIGGVYRTRPGSNPDLYAQIYDPTTGFVVDAYSVAQILIESEGIQLPADERRTDEETVTKLARKIVIAIRANPQRRTRHGNIAENLRSTPIANALPFPLLRVEQRKRAEDVFRLFGEEKVVTAARRGQKISEAPSNIVVLTREMIRRRGYLTLTEALQDVPFFDFTTFHDSGEYPTHFLLRGLTDVGQTKVLTMEDGIVQNDINFGWARNMAFNTTFADVERIEVILGPGSALYGANAYAGLVNVITKDADDFYDSARPDGFFFNGGLLYGQDRRREETFPFSGTALAPLTREDKQATTRAGDGLAAYKFAGGLRLQLAARWYKADGDGGDRRPDPGNYFHNNYEPKRVFTTEYGNVINDESGGTTKRLRDGFDTSKDAVFLRGRLAYERFTLGFNYWDRREGLASYVPGHEYFTNDPDKLYQAHHRGYGAHATYESDIGRRSTLRSRLYYRASLVLPDTGFIYTYRFQDVEKPVLLNGTLVSPVSDKCKCYHAEGQVFGVEEQLNIQPSATNDLVLGLQVERVQRQFLGISLGPQQAGDSNIVPFTFSDNGPFDQTTKTEVYYTTNSAFFVQDEQQFLRDYAITGGLRYDVLSDVDGADRIRIGNKQASAGVLNLRAGLVGNPRMPGKQTLNFKLLYGEAFKSPTLFELFDEFRGNPDLKPQRIETYEVLTSYSPRRFISLQATYFFSLLQDVIEIRPNDGTIPIGSASQKETFSQNVEATHMYGGTFGVTLRFGKWLYLYGDYSITADRDRKTPLEVVTNSSGRITSVDLLRDGHEIDNIAMRKMNFVVNFLWREQYNFNLRANRVGRRKAPVTNKYFQPYDYQFARSNYDYEVEGTPDGYMSGYTIWHFTFTWKDAMGNAGLEPQLIVRNLFNTEYAGIGRQAGSSVRPLSAAQPDVGNPPGFIPPYHPQPGREVLVRVSYRF